MSKINVHTRKASHTQTLAGTKKDASMKTLTISGNAEPSLKLALGFETLWGKFNQNKHKMYLPKMHVCCLLSASSFVVEVINQLNVIAKNMLCYSCTSCLHIYTF